MGQTEKSVERVIMSFSSLFLLEGGGGRGKRRKWMKGNIIMKRKIKEKRRQTRNPRITRTQPRQIRRLNNRTLYNSRMRITFRVIGFRKFISREELIKGVCLEALAVIFRGSGLRERS